MKSKYVFVVLAILLFFPVTKVKADCSNSDIVKLNEIAGNVVFTPIFKEESGTFDIIISNLQSDIYFTDINNNKKYYYSADEITLGSFTPNISYRFKFFSNNVGCKDKSILSKYVNLPGYNPYYKDSLCKGLESKKFCQKWVNYSYSYDTFKDTVNKYKQSQNKKIVEEEQNKVMGMYDYLLLYYTKYYYIILPAIIVLIIFVIFRLRKKDQLF